MKHDLYPIFIDGLNELYGLGNKNTNQLYKYVYMRSCINYNKKRVNDSELFNFIIDELNLSTFNHENTFTSDYLNYKDEKHSIFDSKMDFIDNFTFRADLEGGIDIKRELEEVFKKSYRKSYKYRGLSNYNEYRKYNRLLILNEMFEANPVSIAGIDGFKTSKNHNPFKRSLEEALEAELKISEHSKNDTTTFITEKDLEDYLIDRLELIEPGLEFMKRQVSVSGGFIDILAKDSNDSICIIELKINEDKNIVWQALHYPKEIEYMYRGKGIRMITIAPTYSNSIRDVLKGVDNVEMLSYDIKVKSGKIVDLKIKG